MKACAAIFLGLLTTAAHAGSGTSADYAIATQSFDAGGSGISSANYAINASVSSVDTTSQSSSSYMVLSGYPGQIYNAVGLAVAAPASIVDEGLEFQLSAVEQLDDGTYLEVNPGSVSWSVLTGPVSSVSGAGVATAGTASQNTAASVQGSYGGFNNTVNLTVIPLAISTGSSEQAAITGQPFSFTISPAGSEGPFTYQWMRNGSHISSGTGSTYSIASASAGDAGNYTVQVTNSLGSYITGVFDLTVNAAIPAMSPRALAALALLILLVAAPFLRVKQPKS